MLTQTRLQELMHYDPETGVFTNIKARKKISVGSIAGYTCWRGYVHMTIDRKPYLAHRLAWLYMTGKWPDFEIDHENHKRNDNRFTNLVEKTTAQNNKNLSLRRTNKSGVTGVRWSPHAKAWIARIHADGKEYSLGHFANKDEAVRVRKQAEKQHGFHPNHGKAIQ